MKFKFYLIQTFWYILIFIFLLTTIKAESSEINISTLTIQPGEFIKVVANEPHNSIVWVKFLNKTKELLFDKGQYVGLIPASYYTRPGVYPMLISIINGNEINNKEYSIEIVQRQFPEDRIRVPEKTRKEILTTENRNSDTQKANQARETAENRVLPPQWEKSFLWPIQGRVSTKFGLIRYVNDIENGRHSGLDISAPSGTPMIASNSGKIVFAGRLYLTGLTVIIHHGVDLFSSYGHLSKIEVKAGDEVRRGDLIGKVGMTGLATGPHVHLTFRIGDTPVDPYLFLDKEINWAN